MATALHLVPVPPLQGLQEIAPRSWLLGPEVSCLTVSVVLGAGDMTPGPLQIQVLLLSSPLVSHLATVVSDATHHCQQVVFSPCVRFFAAFMGYERACDSELLGASGTRWALGLLLLSM